MGRETRLCGLPVDSFFRFRTQSETFSTFNSQIAFCIQIGPICGRKIGLLTEGRTQITRSNRPPDNDQRRHLRKQRPEGLSEALQPRTPFRFHRVRPVALSRQAETKHSITQKTSLQKRRNSQLTQRARLPVGGGRRSSATISRISSTVESTLLRSRVVKGTRSARRVTRL